MDEGTMNSTTPEPTEVPRAWWLKYKWLPFIGGRWQLMSPEDEPAFAPMRDEQFAAFVVNLANGNEEYRWRLRQLRQAAATVTVR